MTQNRIVLITGAAGGIGSAFVKRFLRDGDTVIATDKWSEGLKQLRENVDDASKLVTVDADVSNEADCRRLAAVAKSEAGRVDVLINCAGYFPIRLFEEMTLEDWNEVIGINLTGTFLVIRNILPLMKGRGWGRLINIGSASIFGGVPGQAHYVAAKSGIVGLSRSLARELGEYGITVNVVTPGLTSTPPVLKNMPPEMLKEQRERRAIKRDEQAEDLVGAVAFLASAEADFITGQILNVDGGSAMH